MNDTRLMQCRDRVAELVLPLRSSLLSRVNDSLTPDSLPRCHAVFEARKANPVQMTSGKSTTPNRIRGGLAKPNNTKAAKKRITVERGYIV
jgi:hypothetical protein